MITHIQVLTGHGIRQICTALQAPRSSYYHAATPTDTKLTDAHLGVLITEIFKRHRRRYGYRRIHSELTDKGITCAPDPSPSNHGRTRTQSHTAQELHSENQRWPCRQTLRKSSARLPSSREIQPSLGWRHLMLPSGRTPSGHVAFAPVHVAPLHSYIPTSNGWLYLAVIIDLYSREIVGWVIADHMRAELVIAALQQALGSRAIDAGLIFHSDRGSQYGSTAHRQILSKHGIRQSMSARANPYHNAWTESFMGTLKTEMLDDGIFQNATDARIELFGYIESYYNTPVNTQP